MIFDADDVVLVVWVIVSQMQHDVEFNLSLVCELLFVSDYFYSDDFTRLVIEAF